MSSGAASLLAWTGAAGCALAAVSLWGTGALGQARAATAADLAALAGADAVAVGDPAPCAVAEAVAARNSAELISCTRQGDDVLVETGVDAAPLPPATARARAGPAPHDPQVPRHGRAEGRQVKPDTSP